ncbi:DUF4194 domain-containing protein [Hydrogenophaga borbori]
MNSNSEDWSEGTTPPADSIQALQESQRSVFEGDAGTLPQETRRTLVQLLAGPVVDGQRNPKVWDVVVRDEAVLRSRLHDLYMDLVLDRDHKVAFLRQVVSDEVDVPILLRRNTLSFIETALLLFLRLRLTESDSQGDRAVLSPQEMLEHLKVYERSDNVDQARFTRQCESAVEKAKKLGLLRKLAGSNERMEVSPALKLIFPAEEIERLTRAYDIASKQEGVALEGGAGDDEGEEGA